MSDLYASYLWQGDKPSFHRTPPEGCSVSRADLVCIKRVSVCSVCEAGRRHMLIVGIAQHPIQGAEQAAKPSSFEIFLSGSETWKVHENIEKIESEQATSICTSMVGLKLGRSMPQINRAAACSKLCGFLVCGRRPPSVVPWCYAFCIGQYMLLQ